jgi:hypothetical protein
MSRMHTIKKKDYQRTVEHYKTTQPGHLYFEPAPGFDEAGENSDVVVKEYFTFELGQYRSVYNDIFKKIQDCRRDDSELGWYSSIAQTINGVRKEAREDAVAAFTATPYVPTAGLSDMNVVMTDFPESFVFDLEDVGESDCI